MIFGIFPNLEKEGINLVLQRLISILDDLGTPYKFLVLMKHKIENLGLDLGESYVSIEELAHADCILSVGGDGSFLGAARTFSDYDTLIAGIHLGDLGFLNSITTDDMKERIKLILEGEYLKESRLFLHSEIEHANGEKEILPDVLNDVVIGHNKIGQLVRVQLSINDHFIQEYASDGLIVSSPTGTTGYSLSCGGPVLGPSDTRMTVVPICAHTLQRYSMVLNDTDIVKITVPERENTLQLSLDGTMSFDFPHSDILRVRGISKPIRFVRFEGQEFFSSITKKLIRKMCN